MHIGAGMIKLQQVTKWDVSLETVYNGQAYSTRSSNSHVKLSKDKTVRPTA